MDALIRRQHLPNPLPQPELHGARLNHLLAALPDVDFDLIARHLEPINLRLGESIYEPDRPLHHAIFPTTSIVSLHYVTATGASAETAAVGREGMVGLALFMGGHTTASSARVLVAGGAVRLPAGELRRAFDGVGSLRGLLLRDALSLIAQITLFAACNRHHPIEQQFCRWLLCALDRLQSGEMVMTHELVANTLGVRRESITEVAGRLQQAGVIRYRRGHISVLDRAGLEHRACECYAVVKGEQLRLLASIPASHG
ncbi:Crp/Fnr family transcriptional regulator [Hydrogenophaga sp.]|uniref:Crp/Fnr family transcriptional regulator n=1 Tax=Hydrogenophaga sp. TaxID=1904254 RepID=UPI002726EBC3|nr:Crp/Fnr family transcriptional regulator [Hydrogenophaga sp.]MDO8905677.1 Crp/Fnr family transcriptional regulator [Hydrogenophaga sp.]